MDAREVTDHLLRNAVWTASRSGGPGGQRRDKVSTKAELTLEEDSLDGLEPYVAGLLHERLGFGERPVRITIQDERSLSQNQEIAAERLLELVTAALAPPPPKRRPTRPSQSKRKARVDDKTRRGGIKRLRQAPGDAD